MQRFPFEGFIEGYVVNFLKHNYWKISHLYGAAGFEDGISEAKLTYCRLIRRLEKNGHTIENDKHFMSLFKTAWTRYFIDLARKDSKKLETPLQDLIKEEGDEDFILNLTNASMTHNTGYFEIVLEQAPIEVQQVFSLLFSAPKEVIDLATESWSFSNRDSTLVGNAFLCKLLGYDPKKINLPEKVKEYLLTE